MTISCSVRVVVAVWLCLTVFCLRFSLEAAAVDSLGKRVEPLEDEPPLSPDPEEYQELLLDFPLEPEEPLPSAFPFGAE